VPCSGESRRPLAYSLTHRRGARKGEGGEVNAMERVEFLEAMREAVGLIKQTQVALQRARSRCHGELYEQVNSLTKQFYESRTKSEWLRYAALAKVEPVLRADPESREGPDRRIAIDRRIQAMRQQLLPATPLQARA
jgi:hypothetical protein